MTSSPATRLPTEMSEVLERGPYGAQYVVYPLEHSQEIGYQMDIMIQIRPQFLLPVFRQATSNGHRYAYPVTGIESLTELAAQKPLGRKESFKLIEELLQILQLLEDQLLSTHQVLLKPESIFLRSDGKLRLVFRPFLPAPDGGSVYELVSWLAQNVAGNRILKTRWEKQASRLLKAPANPAVKNKSVSPVIENKSVSYDADSKSAGNDSPGKFNKKYWQQIIKFLSPALCAIILLWIVAWQADILKRQADWTLDLLLKHNWQILVLTVLILVIPILVKHSLAQKIDINLLPLFKKLVTAIQKKIAASPANQEKMCELPTELLSSRQELFRLATLSEGMIGTNAETAGQRAFILNDEFIIGRDSRSVDLCLTGYAIGRQHARITRQGAAFFITDLGSKNGTRLNGERLNKMETVLLPDTCQLQFADRLFYFEAEKLPVGD